MRFALERLRKHAEVLQAHLHHDIRPVEGVLFKPGNFLTLAEAEADPAPWEPFAADRLWGGRDQHGWFRFDLSPTPDREGREVVLTVKTSLEGWDATNPQFKLFVDGQFRQAFDTNHRDHPLRGLAGAPGSDLDVRRPCRIDLHAYSGRTEHRCTLVAQTAVLNRPVLDLYYNLMTPVWTAERLDEDDGRRDLILRLCTEALNLVDLRSPGSADFQASVDRANAYLLKEFYGTHCGASEVAATCVGHTHIDVAWHWTVAQTREKAARSFATVLQLMDEYPEYTFLSSQPELYKMVKEDHPDLYARIQARVAEGRWETDGGMWLEADCNVPSGESLVRQFVHGIRFFQQEFGVRSRILWLPDVFGYSAALPQILKLCGIPYFMTTKISWNQYNKVPMDTFQWRGLDGSEVLTHFITTNDPYQKPGTHFTTYNGQLHPGALIGGWKRYQHKDLFQDVLASVGWGDGGGGTTREMIEIGRRMARGIPGAPKVSWGTNRDYFRRLEAAVTGPAATGPGVSGNAIAPPSRLPTWAGELYLEYHRGTYTSMARNKRDNRRSELLFQRLEFLASVAQETGLAYPADDLADLWHTVLVNQFHDILPGSSIHEVYEVTAREYAEVLGRGEALVHRALGALADRIGVPGPGFAVFNTLSIDRPGAVVVPAEGLGPDPVFVGSDGRVLASQPIADGRSVAVSLPRVPAQGYTTILLTPSTGTVRPPRAPSGLVATPHRLENRRFALSFDPRGRLVSIFDKAAGREVLAPNREGNVLQVYEDRPMNFDNWDIDDFHRQKGWIVDDLVSVTVVEEGPVSAALELRWRFLESTLVQTIRLWADLDRIDFHTVVDWNQSQLVLKALFPVDVNAQRASFEIQFGHVERPTHRNTSWDEARFETVAHRWADLSDAGYGVSLLNDSKYGHDIHDGEIRLTLIKSGIEPNPVADRERHEFTYSLFPHSGDWRDAGTLAAAAGLNQPLVAVPLKEGPAPGTRTAGTPWPAEQSYFRLDADHVVLDTVKQAEDGDGLILRLYEAHNRRGTVTLTCHRPLAAAWETNLLEEDGRPLEVLPGRGLTLVLQPFEIKTLRVRYA